MKNHIKTKTKMALYEVQHTKRKFAALSVNSSFLAPEEKNSEEEKFKIDIFVFEKSN